MSGTQKETADKAVEAAATAAAEATEVVEVPGGPALLVRHDGGVAAAHAAQVAADYAMANADQVRLVPADPTVHDVSVPAEEGGSVTIARPSGGEAGYIVAASDADDVIASFASYGMAVKKEPVA